MKAPPRRTKGVLVFLIATSLIGLAIVSTFLLANDKRNLKALVDRYDLRWLRDVLRPHEEPALPAAAPLPASPAPARLPPPPHVTPPSHAFDPVTPEVSAGFARQWEISGADLCARLAEAGIAVGPWVQSGFDAGTFECSYESPPAAQVGPQAASFFIIVRGTPSGEVSNLRIKLIVPDGQAAKNIKAQFAAVLALLAKETRWDDFSAPFADAGAFRNATQTAFGAKLTFFHEYSDPQRFNFVLGLEGATPAQRRTGAYFETEKWLPIPPQASN
ncbi:DUF6030 family protein [Rhizobium sp. RAF56]|jgi:hypothetical protein|uniref:DUF6030 family protein n=1 Tax=Rhizobium sp. RAF56 TaxID=3233062 RepID=UPI003F966401